MPPSAFAPEHPHDPSWRTVQGSGGGHRNLLGRPRRWSDRRRLRQRWAAGHRDIELGPVAESQAVPQRRQRAVRRAHERGGTVGTDRRAEHRPDRLRQRRLDGHTGHARRLADVERSDADVAAPQQRATAHSATLRTSLGWQLPRSPARARRGRTTTTTATSTCSRATSRCPKRRTRTRR